MAGQQARMVFTDHPYNVAIDGHVGGSSKIKNREFAMASGETGQNGQYRTNVWEYRGVNTMRAGRMEELALHPRGQRVG